MGDNPKLTDRQIAIPGDLRLCDDRFDALPPERLAEIRHRLATGVYDSAAIIDAVARGIADSADI